MINRLSERVVSWLRREGCVEASEVPLFRYIGIRSGSHVPVQVRTTKMAVSGCLSKLLVSLV